MSDGELLRAARRAAQRLPLLPGRPRCRGRGRVCAEISERLGILISVQQIYRWERENAIPARFAAGVRRVAAELLGEQK